MVALAATAARSDWRADLIWVIGTTAVFVGLYSIIAAYSLSHPPCSVCDAVGYGVAASSIQANGLFADWPSSELRTYGYPAFVALILSGADWSTDWAVGDPRIAVAQGFLYLTAAVALFLAVRPLNRTLALCCLIGLLCNPMILLHLPVRLTEGLVAPIFVFIVAIAIRLCREPSGAGRIILFLLGGALAGYAVAIRPSMITLLAAWVVFCAAFFVTVKPRGAFWLAAATTVGVIAALAPQLTINLIVYDRLTIFPTYDLAGLQTRAGLGYLKYMTALTAEGAEIWRYPNRFFDRSLFAESPGVTEYLRQPLAGLATMATHVFHSLNFDFLFTYNYARSQWVAAPLNALNHTLLAISAIGLAGLIIRRAALRDPVFWLAGSAALLTLAANSISAPETRFGLIVFCIAGPFGVYRLVRWWTARSLPRVATVSIVGAVIAIGSATILPAQIVVRVVGA